VTFILLKRFIFKIIIFNKYLGISLRLKKSFSTCEFNTLVKILNTFLFVKHVI